MVAIKELLSFCSFVKWFGGNSSHPDCQRKPQDNMVKLLVEELDALVDQRGRFVWKPFLEKWPNKQMLVPRTYQTKTIIIILPFWTHHFQLCSPHTKHKHAAYILRFCPFYAMKCWMHTMSLRQMTEGGEPSPQDISECFRIYVDGTIGRIGVYPVPLIAQALFVSRPILSRNDPGLGVFLLCLCIKRSFVFFVIGLFF